MCGETIVGGGPKPASKRWNESRRETHRRERNFRSHNLRNAHGILNKAHKKWVNSTDPPETIQCREKPLPWFTSSIFLVTLFCAVHVLRFSPFPFRFSLAFMTRRILHCFPLLLYFVVFVVVVVRSSGVTFFSFFSLRSFAILCVAKRAKFSRPALLIASSHLILN